MLSGVGSGAYILLICEVRDLVLMHMIKIMNVLQIVQSIELYLLHFVLVH